MKISFHQLQAAPELALVVAIDRVVAIAADALYAAQPELYDEHLEHTPLRCMIAGHLVRDMSALRKLLARYPARSSTSSTASTTRTSTPTCPSEPITHVRSHVRLRSPSRCK